MIFVSLNMLNRPSSSKWNSSLYNQFCKSFNFYSKQTHHPHHANQLKCPEWAKLHSHWRGKHLKRMAVVRLLSTLLKSRKRIRNHGNVVVQQLAMPQIFTFKIWSRTCRTNLGYALGMKPEPVHTWRQRIRLLLAEKSVSFVQMISFGFTIFFFGLGEGFNLRWIFFLYFDINFFYTLCFSQHKKKLLI